MVTFLFGKRLVTTEGIVTDYDSDFNFVTRIEGSFSPVDIETHLSKTRAYTQAISKIAPFLEKALPIVISLMTPPTGWIKAGIKLVRLLFEAKLGNWSGSHSA